jgi:hypothetical protein
VTKNKTRWNTQLVSLCTQKETRKIFYFEKKRIEDVQIMQKRARLLSWCLLKRKEKPVP